MAREGRPLVTYTLIAVCVVVYVFQLAFPRVTEAGFFSPSIGLAEPWRFLTAAFLHAQTFPLHLVFNMLLLWSMGQFLEPVLGRARFLALYLISAVGGSVGFLLLADPPHSLAQMPASAWFAGTVGASGAVFGLFATAIFLLRHLGRSASGMVILVAINAFLPLLYPNIAWQAHLGGFVTGAALSGILIVTRPRQRRPFQWPAIAGVVVLLVAATALKYALAGAVGGALVRL